MIPLSLQSERERDPPFLTLQPIFLCIYSSFQCSLRSSTTSNPSATTSSQNDHLASLLDRRNAAFEYCLTKSWHHPYFSTVPERASSQRRCLVNCSEIAQESTSWLHLSERKPSRNLWSAWASWGRTSLTPQRLLLEEIHPMRPKTFVSSPCPLCIC